jgi:PucR C-terminal helix-turn-helix domain/GGDEF-like domain
MGAYKDTAVTSCGAEATTFEGMYDLLTADAPAGEQGASGRSLPIDALLYGPILDEWRVWEIANHLRLPCRGTFVVIAAEAPAVGEVALADIEPKLRSLDVYSAWLTLPDMDVGIVHIKSERHRHKILELLSRTTTGRVGVSAPFDDLRDTPQALHVAKVTLRSRAPRTSSVAVFDGSLLATAAVSAPAAMVKSAATVLEGFDAVGEQERQLLFETFRVWQENDASVRATAEMLFCHPNTVRYRLRRIEQHTGRMLCRPKDLAELCLAFEVHRQLM